jgi:glycosyltransferase involved in cell wall biosynthesis
MQPELKVRKILGRTYLNENRLAEALDIFVNILRDYPDDLETLLIVGGFYLAGGDGKTAKSIYIRAQKLDPQNKNIEHQIRMADELSDEKTEQSVPTDMDSVSRLLQQLTGTQQVIKEEEITQAATLLEKIVDSQNPAELVSAHLDEIDDLLQALIEVNIRQARADGRKDIAEALCNLQLNIDYQLVKKEAPGTLTGNWTEAKQPSFTGNLLMLIPDLEKRSSRMTLLKSTFESFGCHVDVRTEYDPNQRLKLDLVIASNPHINPALTESLSILSRAGVPIILDLDTDFMDQPVFHQEYAQAGLGTQARSSDYASAISFADLITVSSSMQAAALQEAGKPVFVIPDGWSHQNRLWERIPTPHGTINIGWSGTSGELNDLMLIRRFIIRIIREFSNTRIVIIGNPQAYRLFDCLPENRRMYIPLVAHEEFPYLLSQLDILLVPLRNLPYNLSLPDTILMQAGARGIPWLASPIPAFRDWKNGGLLTDMLDDEWHLNLRHLVMDQELRIKLGRAGREAAKDREMEHLGQLWLDAISQLTIIGELPSQQLQEVKNPV